MKFKTVIINLALGLLLLNPLDISAKTKIDYKNYINPTQWIFSNIDLEDKEEKKLSTMQEEIKVSLNESEQEDVLQITPEEVSLIKKTVMAEVGYNQPDLGVVYVTDVLLNRKKSERFPNTFYGIITEKNQFESWSNGRINSTTIITAQVDRIVDKEIRNGPTNSTLLFFTAGQYNPYCIPDFKVGSHYFGH